LTALVEPSQLEKMIAVFKASPGRSSAVTGLVVILIVAWARLLVGGKTGPAPARGSAAGNASAVTIKAETPWAARPTDSASRLRKWAEAPVKPLARNPFTIPLDSYPHDGSKMAAEASGTGYWDLVRKSMSARADQQEQRQILVDNVRIAAGTLKLQSTIMGKKPGAMLNGQMVREGSTVSGFHVVKIEARRVIVEREGVKLALMMD
jgi:hypothetical protein